MEVEHGPSDDQVPRQTSFFSTGQVRNSGILRILWPGHSGENNMGQAPLGLVEPHLEANGGVFAARGSAQWNGFAGENRPAENTGGDGVAFSLPA